MCNSVSHSSMYTRSGGMGKALPSAGMDSALLSPPGSFGGVTGYKPGVAANPRHRFLAATSLQGG